MTKILLIETSPKGSDSLSRKAGRLLIDQLRKKGPVELIEKDLQKENLPHVDGLTVSAYFTPPDQLSAEQKKAIERSDRLVEELLSVDAVVISTPMWNFGVPSTLKAWIDHIVRAGKTFRFTENGLEGLLKGKKVYVVVSSGSVFSAGAFQTFDHVAPYFKSVFGFMGVLDLELIRVEGTNSPESAATAFEKAKHLIEAI
jgi:FMN-dependent NADH-azoreductase